MVIPVWVSLNRWFKCQKSGLPRICPGAVVTKLRLHQNHPPARESTDSWEVSVPVCLG